MESGPEDRTRKGTGTVYRIVVRDEIGERFGLAFEEVEMEVEARGGNTIPSEGISRITRSSVLSACLGSDPMRVPSHLGARPSRGPGSSSPPAFSAARE